MENPSQHIASVAYDKLSAQIHHIPQRITPEEVMALLEHLDRVNRRSKRYRQQTAAERIHELYILVSLTELYESVFAVTRLVPPFDVHIRLGYRP